MTRGATDVMLRAQEEAAPDLHGVHERRAHQPGHHGEYIRKNGALFNREPFISVRDDLLENKSSRGQLPAPGTS